MSSLKDLASLIMVPSLVKDGRLDTVKPLGNSIIHPDATGNNDGTDGSTPAKGNFTFSRGSNLAATRVDVNGLIEKGRENILTYSNDFTNSIWVKSFSSVTSGQADRNGGTNAFILIPSTLSTSKYIYQNNYSKTGLNTGSVYVKYSGYHAQLRVYGIGGNRAYANFDLQNGTKGTSGGDSIVDSVITSIGNDWYRITFTINHSGSYNVGIGPIPSPTSSEHIVFAGDGTSGIFLQDFQLESSMVATDYIETGASTAQAGILEDLPRLDYSGGASCPSLLLEPQRTNQVTNSEYVSSSDYVVGNWTGTITTNTTETTSPEGVYNATKYVKSGASDRVYFHSSQPDGAYTGSVWLKAASGSENTTIEISVRRFGGGGGSTSKLVTITNEWQRFDVTATNLTGGTTTAMYVADFSMGGTATEFYSYGMQIEAGSYATSYIPTMGSAVTRSADYVQQNTLRPNNLSGSAFTYFLDMNVNTSVAAFSGYFNEVDSGGAYKAGFVWSNGLQWRTPVGGGNYYVTLDSVLAKGDRAKMLVAVDGTERRVYYNGTLIITIPNCDNDGADTDGIVPYYGSANVNFYSGLYNQIVVFDTALTDSECIALTTI